MEIGKYYKVLGTNNFHPELQPEGTIVKCVEDKGNNFYIVKLIYGCGKKLNKDIGGWIINEKNILLNLI